MNMNEEQRMKRDQALSMLQEAAARLMLGQFWLSATQAGKATAGLSEMIGELRAIRRIAEGAELLTASLADEKRIEGERALIRQAVLEGGAEEITIEGGVDNEKV
jgi:hypothetical protein